MKTHRFFAAILLIVIVLVPVGASAAPTLVPPGSFGKVDPANGAAVMTLTPVLTWGTSTDASSYAYCYGLTSTNPCDGYWISTGAQTSGQLSGLFPSTTYYWQVRATNTSGTTYADGSETAVWSFTTGNLSQMFVRSKGAQDGWVLESGEFSGVGGTMNSTLGTVYVGDNSARKQYRVILSFDTSGLPDTATISSVTLKVKKAGISGKPFATLGKIAVDIRRGYFGTAGGLQLGDFKAAASKSAAMMIANTPVSGWYSAVLNPLYFTYVKPNGLTQFRLRFSKGDDNDRIADYLKLYSGNAATSAYRPELIVDYYEP